MKRFGLLILAILLGFSCAKKPDDKYPEHYDRDFFKLNLFDKSVTLITGEYSSSKKEKRKVIFKNGEEKLKKLFSDYELRSSQENETINVQFELTPSFLIAYRYLNLEQINNLSLEEKIISEEKNNQTRIPLFFLPIKGFGVFERVKNNLDEKTNNFAFKDKEKRKSSHAKIGTKNEDRIIPKVRGLTFQDKQRLIDLKNDIDLTKRYIYVPSTLGAPRDIAQAKPFFQGQEKIVQLGLSENGIEVYNLDPKKKNFTPLLTNRPSLDETPVLTIPGRFIEISCEQDAQGNCTPTYGTEKKPNITWKQKRFFIPKIEKLRVHDKNILDLQHLKSDSCWSQGSDTQYISHTIKKGVLNLHLEKNIKINNLSSYCLNNYWTSRMRHFSFNVRHFYSLVRLENFIPKEEELKYRPVLYPPFDRKSFGFFHTDIINLNPEGEFKRKEIKSYLSRWNPKRRKGKIFYYLTNSFIEEEKEIQNKRQELNNNSIPSLNEITHKAFQSINKGLKIAGAPFTLHLCSPKIRLINNKKTTFFENQDCQDEVKNKIGQEGALPGDIRYNTIALIRPSIGNGLLGYGPNVVHPETGEVLHGHINMYEGNLKKQTRRLWTQIASIENIK